PERNDSKRVPECPLTEFVGDRHGRALCTRRATAELSVAVLKNSPTYQLTNLPIAVFHPCESSSFAPISSSAVATGSSGKPSSLTPLPWGLPICSTFGGSPSIAPS